MFPDVEFEDVEVDDSSSEEDMCANYGTEGSDLEQRRRKLALLTSRNKFIASKTLPLKVMRELQKTNQKLREVNDALELVPSSIAVKFPVDKDKEWNKLIKDANFNASKSTSIVNTMVKKDDMTIMVQDLKEFVTKNICTEVKDLVTARLSEIEEKQNAKLLEHNERILELTQDNDNIYKALEQVLETQNRFYEQMQSFQENQMRLLEFKEGEDARRERQIAKQLTLPGNFPTT